MKSIKDRSHALLESGQKTVCFHQEEPEAPGSSRHTRDASLNLVLGFGSTMVAAGVLLSDSARARFMTELMKCDRSDDAGIFTAKILKMHYNSTFL